MALAKTAVVVEHGALSLGSCRIASMRATQRESCLDIVHWNCHSVSATSFCNMHSELILANSGDVKNDSQTSLTKPSLEPIPACDCSREEERVILRILSAICQTAPKTRESRTGSAFTVAKVVWLAPDQPLSFLSRCGFRCRGDRTLEVTLQACEVDTLA